MNNYYVYLHRKATNGEVFYVGKGSGNRAWSKGDRSKFWKDTANKYGFTVEIYIANVQEWYAYEVERELISYHGRRDKGTGTLVNMTNGGSSRHSEYDEYKRERVSRLLSESNRDKTKFTFCNVNTQVQVFLDRWEFSTQYNIRVDTISSYISEVSNGTRFNAKIAGEWYIKELVNEKQELTILGEIKRRRNRKDTDLTKYKFLNLNDHEEFYGSKWEFMDKYGIDPSSIVTMYSRIFKGWCIPEFLDHETLENFIKYRGKKVCGKLNPNADNNKYELCNVFTKEFFKGTRIEFYEKFGIRLSVLFNNRGILTVKGWYLKSKQNEVMAAKRYKKYFN